MNLLPLDARWRRFNDETRTCPCCGRSFNGIFDIGLDHPDCWPHGDRQATGRDILDAGEDRLSADLCRWEQHRFICCVLPLPIRGSDEVFHFAVWASVTPENFYRYIDFCNGDAGFDGCFAWLMNDLPGFETEEPIACDLTPGTVAERPTLTAHDGPLAKAQHVGISFDDLLDIYAACGQDIRPHLTA
ncbi:DUF2199 domain-containing protein [Mesobacterium sp. TK19101]|uniref:DUF2199 domain-containing protein n=1 Tax=Mesobacterium hydrothermale TaxID=3111907 RepID=A0ABU6HIN2_9RHOB|nr:DUF2199 domain-containing protein [Mesobacterium sp. TK19101]MEC3861685.1 DUF2199 domain-containing protein [Mesobacterium sp. TK19101]